MERRIALLWRASEAERAGAAERRRGASRGVPPDLASAYRRAQDGELCRLASYAAVPSVRRRHAPAEGPVRRDAVSRLDLLAVRSLWEGAFRR
jgi:hypothetical protein